MATLEDAVGIAAQAHRGQRDKAGDIYLLHPLRLMLRMQSEAEMMVAVLHDVIEDSDWTLERLRERGFPEDVVEAIECLTRKAGEAYDAFIVRVQKNQIARRVKIADLEDNMNVLRLRSVGPDDIKRLEKYHKAWRALTGT